MYTKEYELEVLEGLLKMDGADTSGGAECLTRTCSGA